MVRIVYLSEIAGIEPRIDWSGIPELGCSISEGTGATFANSVSQILRRFGFETFVYLSLISVEASEASALVVTNMPREWVGRYSGRNYLESDPWVESCFRHVTPFLWDSKRSCGPSSEPFLSEAARHGLRSGIALPVRSVFGEKTMFCVSSPNLTLPDGEDLQLAIGRTYILASYFHERFFYKLRKQAGSVDIAPPRFTKREREVLELAAHGQSSKRIAYELGISESTANYHIASIKRKFRVRTRAHAIAQAVQSGVIR